jgi:HD-GYP domain-containing protein (c-di-GMP phosphodiesterase class II)
MPARLPDWVRGRRATAVQICPGGAMLSEQEKLHLTTQIVLDINEVKDIDLLLERILTSVRRVFNADAGSIYLKKKDTLQFSYTQNDTLQSRLSPGRKLIYRSFSMPVNDGSIAGYVANHNKTVNIADVYQLSDATPYSFGSSFDELSNYRTTSMLTVPMTSPRGEVLGVMQVINAQDDEKRVVPFESSDESLIRHFAASAALAIERARMTRDIILRMISMAELRDPRETGAHVNRVGAYSVEIYEVWARKRGIPSEEVARQKDVLRMAAMLHDVGKVAISDLILKKPARLNLDEFEIMKSHTFLGARLFRDINSDFDEVAAQVALNHHERWDGTGYPGHMNPFTEEPLPGYEDNHHQPRPKRAEEIPIFGRIVAIADVYDALCSRRSYKEPWDEDRILEEMRKSSGSHFDPEVVDAFFACLDVLKSIAERYPDVE